MSADPFADVRKAARRFTAAERKLREAREQRDAAVRAALDAGHSLRRVAEAAGMSHAQVANVGAGDRGGARYPSAQKKG